MLDGVYVAWGYGVRVGVEVVAGHEQEVWPGVRGLGAYHADETGL
jgi:hypothetical protein